MSWKTHPGSLFHEDGVCENGIARYRQGSHDLRTALMASHQALAPENSLGKRSRAAVILFLQLIENQAQGGTRDLDASVQRSGHFIDQKNRTRNAE